MSMLYGKVKSYTRTRISVGISRAASMRIRGTRRWVYFLRKFVRFPIICIVFEFFMFLH